MSQITTQDIDEVLAALADRKINGPRATDLLLDLRLQLDEDK
jgi:hypothetical protein